ncbi:MAG TPA: arylamine N-acetyltransferase, partial [Acidimicrobiales bacterium]|nr:arylamine N-acetyltransferase [Acidimicrobiales bacterium]
MGPASSERGRLCPARGSFRQGGVRLTPELVDPYLKRLGLEREAPSAEALARLHKAHAERVAYETVWIHSGSSWPIDPSVSIERLATTGRGGYCYHLNGAFSVLLEALGYDVTGHVGGVHGPDGPAEEAMSNHLVLQVAGLPTQANPGGHWYVDVGLGDALHEPMPLVAGDRRQGVYELGLEATPGGVGDWHLSHDPSGSFSGMSWRSPVVTDMEGAFGQRHKLLSTSPDSGFVRVLTVQRRESDAVEILRGLSFKRLGVRPADTVIETPQELAAVLGDVFGLWPLPAGAELAALWRGV